MRTKTISLRCPHCQEQRAFTKNACNHLIHAIVTLCTCTAWLPIWLIAWAFSLFKPYQCTKCGVEEKYSPDRTTGRFLILGSLAGAAGIVMLFVTVIGAIKHGADTFHEEMTKERLAKEAAEEDAAAAAKEEEALPPAPGAETPEPDPQPASAPIVEPPPFPTELEAWQNADGKEIQAIAESYDPETGKVVFSNGEGKTFEYDAGKLAPESRARLEDLAAKK